MMFSHQHQWRLFRPPIDLFVVSWIILPSNSVEWRCSCSLNVSSNLVNSVANLTRIVIYIGITASWQIICWKLKSLLRCDRYNHALLARFLSRPAYFNLRSGLVESWQKVCWVEQPVVTITIVIALLPHSAGRPPVIVHGDEIFEERLELAKCLTTSNTAKWTSLTPTTSCHDHQCHCCPHPAGLALVRVKNDLSRGKVIELLRCLRGYPEFFRWLPIFRMFSKLFGYFQMTANFTDDRIGGRGYPKFS